MSNESDICQARAIVLLFQVCSKDKQHQHQYHLETGWNANILSPTWDSLSHYFHCIGILRWLMRRLTKEERTWAKAWGKRNNKTNTTNNNKSALFCIEKWKNSEYNKIDYPDRRWEKTVHWRRLCVLIWVLSLIL